MQPIPPRRLSALPAAAAFLSGLACAASGGEGGPASLDDARASLRSADSAYSALAGREGWSVALLAMRAEDGFLVRGAETPPRSEPAVRALLASDTLLGAATATWRPIRWDVSADRAHGYSYGYVDAVRPDGRPLPGKYSAYWRRGEDGGWRVVAYRRAPRPPGDLPPAPEGFGPPADTVYAPRPPADRAALVDSVAANERAFSALAQTEAGLGGAFAAFAAPDGVNFGRGPGMVWGREAIASQFEGYPADQGFTWEPDIVEVAPSGDLAFTTGPVYPLGGEDGVRPLPVGRYFSIWRRQPDGSWKYVIDG